MRPILLDQGRDSDCRSLSPGLFCGNCVHPQFRCRRISKRSAWVQSLGRIDRWVAGVAVDVDRNSVFAHHRGVALSRIVVHPERARTSGENDARGRNRAGQSSQHVLKPDVRANAGSREIIFNFLRIWGSRSQALPRTEGMRMRMISGRIDFWRGTRATRPVLSQNVIAAGR